LTRAKLEQITADLVDRTIAPVKQALSDADLTAGDIHEIVLVGGMTRMPAIQDRVRAFFGKDPHKGVNPDEVVAIGAAIQAGVLGGEVKDILLLDVTPLTLSIETLGGVATPQIERNTTIPTRRSQVFSTASDNQTQVEIHVLQGERTMAADNKSLGKFILDGIPPAPRGMPQVEVTFDVDANGILKVSAKDKATGRSQHITITASSGLSEAEVEKMRKDAESHAEDDRKRKDLIEVRNNADNTIYAAEKAIRDFGDKVPAEIRSEVESKITEVRSASQIDDVEKIRAAVDALGQSIQKIGASVYQQGDAAPSGDPDVVDGEVKE
jgi:molecular chaperone DnaK